MFPNNVINFTPTRIINLGILRLARLSHWNINISYYSKMINAELWHDFNTKMYIQGGQEKLTLLTNSWYYGVTFSGPLCRSRSKISWFRDTYKSLNSEVKTIFNVAHPMWKRHFFPDKLYFSQKWSRIWVKLKFFKNTTFYIPTHALTIRKRKNIFWFISCRWCRKVFVVAKYCFGQSTTICLIRVIKRRNWKGDREGEIKFGWFEDHKDKINMILYILLIKIHFRIFYILSMFKEIFRHHSWFKHLFGVSEILFKCVVLS